VESVHDTAPCVSEENLEMLAIGSGVSSLALGAGGAPAVFGAGGSSSTGAMLQLEPVERDRRPALLLLAPRPSPARVNGAPAPPLSLLDVGDVIQLGDVLLHVSWFRAPQVGPAAEHLVGKQCPVCRTRIDAGATVYRHDCGHALHLEPDEEGLQCALLGDCAACGHPVSLDSGLSYRPGP
jgi:hypothetical protein